MKGKSKQEWIEKGYEMLATDGFSHVNVESIARSLQKNKSSFYYYFGDWEGFEEDLLNYHLHLAKDFAKSVEKCESVIPDIANLFIAHKTDIFFHKQLRINREKPLFKKCFETVYQLFEEAVKDTWSSFLNLEQHSYLSTKILALLSENFLLQITEDNFTYEWLSAYFLENSMLLRNMSSSRNP